MQRLVVGGNEEQRIALIVKIVMFTSLSQLLCLFLFYWRYKAKVASIRVQCPACPASIECPAGAVAPRRSLDADPSYCPNC